MTDMTDSQDRRAAPLGTLVGGSLLIVVGLTWLLDVLDVITASWLPLLAVALIVIGVALAWGSRTGSHPGLVAFGMVTASLVLFASIIGGDATLAGGIGDRLVTTDELLADPDLGSLGIGSLTVDLREGSPTGEIKVSVGIGDVVVLVDDPSVVTVDARAGIGEVIVFGESSGGFGRELRSEADSPQYSIRASVGIGKVEVRP